MNRFNDGQRSSTILHFEKEEHTQFRNHGEIQAGG